MRRTLLVFGVVLAATAVPMALTRLLPGAIPPPIKPWLIPALSLVLPAIVLGRGAPAGLGLARVSRPGLVVAVVGSLAMPLAFLLEGGRPSVTDVVELVRRTFLP